MFQVYQYSYSLLFDVWFKDLFFHCLEVVIYTCFICSFAFFTCTSVFVSLVFSKLL